MSPDKKRQCVGFIQTFNSAFTSSFCPINPFSLPLNHDKFGFYIFEIWIFTLCCPKKRSIPLLFVSVKGSLQSLWPLVAPERGPYLIDHVHMDSHTRLMW